MLVPAGVAKAEENAMSLLQKYISTNLGPEMKVDGAEIARVAVPPGERYPILDPTGAQRPLEHFARLAVPSRAKDDEG